MLGVSSAACCLPSTIPCGQEMCGNSQFMESAPSHELRSFSERNYVMTRSIPTLTQSGLLAVLLQRRHYKLIQLARRRAYRKQARAAFRSMLNWLLTLAHGGIAGRPFHRGFEERV